MKRRVIFSEVADAEFSKVATRVPVVELHLDQKQNLEQKAKKDEVVKRQKKNKKKNKKGLAAFMENENEADAFKENEDDNDAPIKTTQVEEPIKKGVSVISRTLEDDEIDEQKVEEVQAEEDPLDLEGLD